jgi:hypothetical protein
LTGASATSSCESPAQILHSSPCKVLVRARTGCFVVLFLFWLGVCLAGVCLVTYAPLVGSGYTKHSCPTRCPRWLGVSDRIPSTRLRSNYYTQPNTQERKKIDLPLTRLLTLPATLSLGCTRVGCLFAGVCRGWRVCVAGAAPCVNLLLCLRWLLLLVSLPAWWEGDFRSNFFVVDLERGLPHLEVQGVRITVQAGHCNKIRSKRCTTMFFLSRLARLKEWKSL